MSKDLASDVRNEHLAAGLHAQADEPMCEVTVWCDSATPRATRWHLMVRHGVKRDRRMGRVKCPVCKGKAWWQAGTDDDDEREERPGLAGHLLSPFRREAAPVGDAAVTWCVACEVRALREGDEGRDAVRSADYVIDGMSVCAEDAAPMLAVLADRARS